MKKLLFVFGTRPEAIKLAPLIKMALTDKRFSVTVCSTGQHKEMLEPVLNFFEIPVNYDLAVMKPSQRLASITADILQGLDKIIAIETPDYILVQGDTTSAYAGALVAFYNKIKIAHIEAGLRSGDIYSPFPEEFNRLSISKLADLHFTPTEAASANLLKEGTSKTALFKTGNTGIDALLMTKRILENDTTLKTKLLQKYAFLNPQRRMILTTLHRRESFGTPLREVLYGLLKISQRDDVEILFPIHLNPEVRKTAQEVFGQKALWAKQDAADSTNKIWLTEPLDYVEFIYLMDRCHLIITDSGGVQEEGPSLGKPILVARENTERPEGIAAGCALLLPLQQDLLHQAVNRILEDPLAYNAMTQAQNPYGNGTASQVILDTLAKH